ncbi:MFS transporter [Litorivicinus lipolyticus]|uniref:MFS transporter n=1 Tax=Litorivicinus lipolyticus TaxID=418701 RepID=A0A5Q2QCX1_9GAMM|nr:MFS transporter [Litorivicinus lipolyticus]QGG79690.1 MFS transporter [Litorivicinus lipolyticus]
MTDSRLFTPVLIASSLVLMLGFALRAAFGLFQIPIADEFGWLRAEFSMAIAIQNLAWGIGQPIFGAIAEKFGDRKAIVLGVVTYAAGLFLTAFAVTPGQMQWLEVLVGFGIAGTGFGVILAIVGRAASDENRSMALGIATAAGSAGQVVGPILVATLLDVISWQHTFLVMSGLIFLGLLCLPFIKADGRASKAELQESMSTVLLRAVKDPSYGLIFVGFFSCGFQLGFVTAHFPAFITEACASIAPDSLAASLGIDTTAALGAVAIALIGLANIFGTITAGALGKKYTKKYLLSGIYVARTIISAWFILTPMTPITVVIFSLVMGSLWLATVPLTSGLVAHIYGLRYMGTLYGLVFFSHQLGSFLGVWLGGTLYDQFGTYTTVWWVGIGVGVVSAIVHLPVREAPWQAKTVSA